MSRIGKKPILLPKGIKATVTNSSITLESAKNKMHLAIPNNIEVSTEGESIFVKRLNNTKLSKSLHGTIRMLIHNMIKGLTEGFKKELDIIGVGYKAQVKGNNLTISVGFSHAVEIPIPQGLKVSTPNPNRVIVEGFDKQKVGEFSANLRRIYPPEPYQGKGIRYVGEEVRKKLGKALAK